MKSFYTSISAQVPENYTKPTTSFTKHVWLSVFGLLLFIVLYLGLTIWFGRLAYGLFLDAYNFDGHFWNYLLAIGFAFLSLFMAKSLFFLNKSVEDPTRRYVTKEEEPVLFDYLYKLADEAGAPRPHKVFLTDRVNASVSYDVSLINLLIPSKKNLEIGLGLVNVLSLGEFKAVLAHEFGHFAQRSMLLGRYVYVAQQIAARIVAKRDGFDAFLAGLSGFDLRVAWIGWILSILVWAIRALIETCFGIVVVAERALSREMEFQADLVAVSLTGSDALIHALYKLQIADEAYENALGCLNNELSDKKAVKDMYTLQSNYIQQMGKLLDNPNYGKSPKLPKESRESHRIFTSKKYNPPKMWSTHPADVDRENNAKNIYIYEPVDERSSWDLFSNPIAFREDMTVRLIKTAKVETSIIENDVAIKNQNNEHFQWTFLDSKYRSNFFNRYAFLNFEDVESLFNADINTTALEDEFKIIYPEFITEKISNLKEVQEEIVSLEVSQSESLTLEKRRIWHRGNQVKLKDIPKILEELKTEVGTIQKELASHDAQCRTLHYIAAKKINSGWSTNLKELTRLVHYGEHSITNINDAAKKFNNVLNIALADGNVSSSELKAILDASNDYYGVISSAYYDSEKMELNEELLLNMKVPSYNSMFEEFKLPHPNKENINDWVNVVAGWAGVALNALYKLRNESLELLLTTEAKVKTSFLNGSSLEHAKPIKGAPLEYATLTSGNERRIQTKLKAWDRFITGDGIVPSIAKFAVSGGILFVALFFATYSQKMPFYIYNGLQTSVDVLVDNKNISLEPNSYETIQLDYGETYEIESKSHNGDELIEKEKFKLRDRLATVYNIANAAAFIRYPVFYGYENRTPPGLNDRKLLGARKFFNVKADYILEEPPAQISLSENSLGEIREAVIGYSAIEADNIASIVEDEGDFESMVKSHSRWDESESNHLTEWMYYLKNMNDGFQVIESRLESHPNEIASLRLLQDVSDSTSYRNICEKHVKLSKDNPKNGDYYYLATRCIDDEKLKDQKFIEGYEQWNDNTWLAYASGYIYAQKNDYENAFIAFSTAAKNASLKNYVAIESERVRRLLNLKGDSNFNTLLKIDDYKYYNNLETGGFEEGNENAGYIYYLIQKGNLEEAYKLSMKFDNSKFYTDYLIAISNGAKSGIKNVVLNQEKNEGLNLNTVWGIIGLAVKEGKDYKKYLEVFQPLELDSGFIENLVGLIKTRNYNKVEVYVSELQVRWQLQAYVMATVMLDGNVPLTWKNKIKAGLFADERPYLD